jgi:threonine dehydrogenase-like Zn-dependent dehydrogenase
MQHKAIASYCGRSEPAWVETSPPESLPAHQVICRTLQLGVCGTDREIIQAAQPLTPVNSEYLILGHECLARVEAVGSEVNELAVGDLVVPSVRRVEGGYAERPDMLPPEQFTERGIIHQHGFSQPFWLDDPHYLLRVPPALADLAVFTEPQSVAEKAVNEAILVQQARLDSSLWQSQPPRVLVTGMGSIGFAGVVAAVCRNWPVTMYGRDPADSPRVQLCQQLGAKYLNQQQVDLGSLPEPQRFDLILECTGADVVLMAASHALAHCGAMVWLGAARTDHERVHNLDALMRRSLMGNHLHLGSVNSAPRDFDDALRHLPQLQQENPTAAAGLITRRAAIDSALDHFTQREPRSIKTVFMYEA